MVDSVASTPQYYSYLGNVLGVQNTSQPPATSPAVVTPAKSTSSTNNNPSSPNSPSAVSQLLGGGAGSFAPEILSLLQNNSQGGGFDPVASLLGGTSTYNPFTTVLSNLYGSSAAASITQTKDNTTPPAPASTTAQPTGASLINSLINTSTQASVAYNNANLQNVSSVVTANSYQADGVTPITV